MIQESEAAEQQQQIEQVTAFRNIIIDVVVDRELSYDVVFTGLTQVIVGFVFDYLLVTQGELSEENVAKAIAKFNGETADAANIGLENVREYVRQQSAEQEGISQS